jgi:transposase, IS30 family
MKVYFADPGCPGQRGTNENTNGLIREFFPKKTDFNGVKASEIKEVERLLNKRPRKILGYKTPEEVMEGMLKGGWDPPKEQIISGEKAQR